MTTRRDLIRGLRCETCSKERVFGSPPKDSPDNLYVYTDLSGATRCFCKKHMEYFTEEGITYPCFGARLISYFLEGLEDGR